MDYFKADESTLGLVRDMIEAHHPRLDGARIAVIFKEKATTSRGRTTLATASLPSGKMKPLLDAPYHFMICIGADAWEDATAAKQAALIDHELCHCTFDDDGNPALRPHDLEEFAEIIERHGYWRDDAGEARVQETLGLPMARTPAVVGTIKMEAS